MIRHRKPRYETAQCPGPLIWFEAGARLCAVLECSACAYIVTTGNWHDEAHSLTPVMREGLAA